MNEVATSLISNSLAVHDTKEISETERQFLMNWKLARRRQRKLMAAAATQKRNGMPTAKEILQPAPHPPTMPPLPARKPVR